MPPLVERALAMLPRAAAPLLDFANLTGRVDRRSFCSAVLLAIGLIATGHAMDCFVFDAVQFTRPDFFACFVGAILVLPLLTLGIRRLRDADRSRWLILFLFVPVVGWLLLACWWGAPSGRGAAPARRRSRVARQRLGGPIWF